MLASIVAIYTLLAGVGILLMGSGLLGILLGLRAGLEGFSQALTGVVMSGFFLGYIVGAFVCPPLVHRVGHIRAFAAMASLASAAVILHGLFVEPLAWWVLRLLTGVCVMGLYLVIESWLNEQTNRGQRGRVFAVYMITTLIALGLGQFLILLYGPGGIESFGVVAVLLSLALVPVALTPVREPPVAPAPHVNVRHLYRTSPLGVAGALATGLANGGFWGMGAVFGHGAGLSQAGTAGFMGAVILGGALLQWPIGHQSDRLDRRSVLTVVCFAGGAAAVGAFFAVGAPAPLIVFAALYGGCAFAIYSLVVAHTSDLLEPGEMLEATRGLLLMHGVGATVGPVIVGLLMQATGPRSFLGYLAVIPILLGGFVIHRMRVSRGVPVEEQGEFVPMARTSPVVLELHPQTKPDQADAPAD